MFLHVRRRGEVSRRPCMLIKVCLAPSFGVCGALRCDHFDSRCHFACSSFAMHRRPTAAPPVRTASRDFGLRQVVLVCLRLRAPPDGGIVRRLAQLPFLIERDFSVLQAPSELLF